MRILLIDASELVRTGLRIAMASDSALRVVAGCGTLRDACRYAIRHRVHLVIMERRFPVGDAFLTCRTLLDRLPHLSILFFSDRWEPPAIARAFESGAIGCLEKSLDRRQLLEKVRLAAGVAAWQPARSVRMATVYDNAIQPETRFVSLSARERQLLPLIIEGFTNKEIARTLDLAEKTVKNYLSNTYRKLRVSRRVQIATMYANHSTASL